MKLLRLGLFGLPGAGKGTQAELLARRFLIPHISTGDMFRDLQKGTSPLAAEIREILASGALVPDERVSDLAFERLGQKDCLNGFILDGFPRTLAQAKALQDSPFALDALLSIDVDKDEIIKRLSSRRVCELCQKIFGGSANVSSHCPDDGAKLVQRADDAPPAIARRLAVFEENFAPVVGFYKGLERLYRIDGYGTSDEVFARISRVILQEIRSV